MITVFDYGAGNLHSLVKALEAPGLRIRLETDPRRAVETDALVLPGVGAFAPAAARLAPGRAVMREAIAAGLPCLGICLGMQLFFDGSDEGDGEGLAILSGRVTRLRARRVPQIGWNRLDPASDACPDPLLGSVPLDMVYYANGFVCRPGRVDCVRAWSEHEGDRFPAMVRVASAVGVQFHPEKSSRAGVRFVRAFLEEVLGAPRSW